LSLIVLFFAGITKRAQFPFRSWLPQAIAAPTPTSALVHSRTLVTAGIYLFIKYNFFMIKIVILLVLFIFGFITICVSGVVSLVEKDSKKVIALRTLNQLGFIVSTLGMGNKFLTFFHLITHAFFKRCIFLQIGFFIHNTFSNQDFRNFSYSLLSRFSRVLIFLICLLSLRGVIFLSGFISKEAVLFSFIYSVFYRVSLLVLFFIVMFTLLYSFRLIKIVLNSNYYFEVNKNYVPTIASLFLLLCGTGLGV
jgi:NADH-ubiquinone oxidoreductase chain 5